ncbi:hypothetical protein MCOR17_011921 [Pyricularia oryzae]|nr:hypothetical protein MCOR17_011921 [Pyricularia oryzae]
MVARDIAKYGAAYGKRVAAYAVKQNMRQRKSRARQPPNASIATAISHPDMRTALPNL